MENIVKILKAHYQSFANEKNSEYFFINLAKYVEFIQKNSILNNLVKPLVQKRKKLYNQIKKYEMQSLQELKQSKQELIFIIKKLEKKHSKAYDKLINFSEELPIVQVWGNPLQELLKYEKGQIRTNGVQSNIIESYLCKIARSLTKNGYGSALKSLEDKNPAIKNIYGNFIFSKTINKRRRKYANFAIERQKQLWGYWEYLSLIPSAIYFKKDYIKDSNDTKLNADLPLCIAQGLILARGNIKDLSNWHLELKLDQKEKTAFKQYAKQINNYLFEKLLLCKQEDKINPNNKFIQKIIIVKPKDADKDKFIFVINNNYKNAKTIRKGTWWPRFIELIQERDSLLSQNDFDADKNFIKYFNNSKKCALYYKTGYKPTKILTEDKNGMISICTNIETEIINHRQYKVRFGKQQRNKR